MYIVKILIEQNSTFWYIFSFKGVKSRVTKASVFNLCRKIRIKNLIKTMRNILSSQVQWNLLTIVLIPLLDAIRACVSMCSMLMLPLMLTATIEKNSVQFFFFFHFHCSYEASLTYTIMSFHLENVNFFFYYFSINKF